MSAFALLLVPPSHRRRRRSLPLAWAALLRRHQHRINPQPGNEPLSRLMRDADDSLAPLRFLFGPYRPNCCYGP